MELRNTQLNINELLKKDDVTLEQAMSFIVAFCDDIDYDLDKSILELEIGNEAKTNQMLQTHFNILTTLNNVHPELFTQNNSYSQSLAHSLSLIEDTLKKMETPKALNDIELFKANSKCMVELEHAKEELKQQNRQILAKMMIVEEV